ncbi:hypothetical protein CCHR01_16591 [Colletotrichum chrysophilum]|uniref:Uncharacterized protein n=1 Tax=Colletotrichum chrysophilum TaxID=1836956 RepID=A0AAD9A624_9PEZI|nr:hypothetical protein CCHR01_16591 [Colletotrichum chrysophilum]
MNEGKVGAGGPDEFATHTWYPPKRFLHFVLPVMLPPLLLLLLRVSFKLWPDAQTMYVRQREDLSFKSGLVYGIRLSTPRNLTLTTHLQEIFWPALKFNHPHPTANAVLPLRPFAQNLRHGQEKTLGCAFPASPRRAQQQQQQQPQKKNGKDVPNARIPWISLASPHELTRLRLRPLV